MSKNRPNKVIIEMTDEENKEVREFCKAWDMSLCAFFRRVAKRYMNDFNKVVSNHPKEEIVEGLTLEEAKEHCNNPRTKSDDWFDGFKEA